MRWLTRSGDWTGRVYFRGTLPGRLEDLEPLPGSAMTVTPLPEADPAGRWAAVLRHETWGEALLACPLESEGVSQDRIEMDAHLTPGERQVVAIADGALEVRTRGTGRLLHDRKALLGFMRAVLGRQGVVAVDEAAQRHWSRDALDEELVHGALLDVEALLGVHAVREGLGASPSWLHTHGLAEVGRVDFDVLDPAADLLTVRQDALRALALAILEDNLTLSGRPWTLYPGRDVRMVAVGTYLAQVPRAVERRREPDGQHRLQRGVVCDVDRTLLGRLRRGLRPSRCLSQDPPPNIVPRFSPHAQSLMDERGRDTFPLLCRLTEEFYPYHFPLVATVLYEADGGMTKERLWVDVEEVLDDRIDGVLLTQPAAIARMHPGQHAVHTRERIVDWQIQTPFGLITPRATMAARLIREQDPEKFLRFLEEFRQNEEV